MTKTYVVQTNEWRFDLIECSTPQEAALIAVNRVAKTSMMKDCIVKVRECSPEVQNIKVGFHIDAEVIQ